MTVVVSREGGREGGPWYGRDVTSASRPAVLYTDRKLEQKLSFITSASDNSTNRQSCSVYFLNHSITTVDPRARDADNLTIVIYIIVMCNNVVCCV